MVAPDKYSEDDTGETVEKIHLQHRGFSALEQDEASDTQFTLSHSSDGATFRSVDTKDFASDRCVSSFV